MPDLRKYNIHPEREKFKQLLEELIKTHQIDQIVETGSFDGLGSTKVFAETELPVISLECNFVHYITAKQNLNDFPNVKLLNSYSLKKDEMIDFIKKDKFLMDKEYHDENNILTDNKNHVDFYIWELNNHVESTTEENVLLDLVNNNKKQLIFLDSAGGVGFLEFKEILKIEKKYLKNKIILLDDAFHIKHHRSHKFLIENNIPFEIFDNRMIYFKLNE